jgi:hypothetical protein
MEKNPTHIPFQSPQGYYQFVYPASWKSEIIEGIPSFYQIDGVGAFQIFAFLNKNPDYTNLDALKKYLEYHEIEYDEDLVEDFTNSFDMRILACEFEKDNRYWIVYSLGSGSKTILCLYNSDVEISDHIFQELTDMISSFQIIGN